MWILLFITIVILAFLILLNFNSKPLSFWHENIIELATNNKDWRHVVTTTDNLQLVNMNVPPKEELGWETHPDNDQLFRVVEGQATLQVKQPDGKITNTPLTSEIIGIVPKGNEHNVVNTTDDHLKMYTVYSPPHHPPDTVDHTHADELKRESL